jgi:hypothetical protein
MSEVVHIKGAPIKQLGQPSPEVIAVLEKHLEEAKAGRIRAVGIAVVNADDTTGTEWVFDPEEVVCHQLMAAMTYLQNRYACHRNGIR